MGVHPAGGHVRDRGLTEGPGPRPGAGALADRAGRAATGMVRVVFYAGAAAAAGGREALVPLGGGSAPAGEDAGGSSAAARGGPAVSAASAASLGWLRAELRRRFPALAGLLPACSLAVNGCLVGGGDGVALAPGDVVEVLPPASGGNDAAGAAAPLSAEPLSVDALVSQVAHEDAGAIVVFLGTVRRRTGDRVTDSLFYEAHEVLAERGLERVAAEAERRWSGARVAVAHRLGWLRPGEASVVVAASAPHREEAFAACRFAIEEIKRSVPIWKQEHGPDGAFWVHEAAPGPAEGAGDAGAPAPAAQAGGGGA